MSFSDRRTLLLSLAALAGCGFTPVYAPGGAAGALRNAVVIDDPRDAEGFRLVRQLEDRLGLVETPRYRLSASLETEFEQLGITPDEVISRINILGRARYRLIDLATGETVDAGEVSTFTSYSATGTPFATQTARADALDRLMTALADQIVARLILATDGAA